MERFENRLSKNNLKFLYQNPVWDNLKEDALNVFEMIDLLNKLNTENMQLKSSNLEYEDALARLEEENLQLKKDIEYYKLERIALFEYMDKKDDLQLDVSVDDVMTGKKIND